MAGVSFQQFTPWANYHLTSGTYYGDLLEPQVPVELLGKFHCSDLVAITDPSRFALMTNLVFDYLKEFKFLHKHRQNRHAVSQAPDRGEFRVFPSVQVGSGWSFSGLIGADDGKEREAKLDCSGLAGCMMLENEHRAEHQSGPIALAGGGTRLQELADWAGASVRGLSIKTSGTHMGMTLAGGIATASHGSRLGFGGIQNMIAGMLIVVGETEAVWLEPESAPVMSAAGLAAMTSDRLTNLDQRSLRCIRNDAMFEDALVHLGCMGIVVAVAVRLVPDQLFERIGTTQLIDEDWLKLLANGQWNDVANTAGHTGRAPIFYELTIDPHEWKTKPAAHLFYFDAPAGTALPDAPPEIPPGPGDTVARIGYGLKAGSFGLPHGLVGFVPDVPDPADDDDKALTPDLGPEVPMNLFDPDGQCGYETNCAFDQYLCLAGFKPNIGPITATWAQLHRGVITGGYPGALYNASWAIPRDRIADVLPAICAAVRQFPRSFVFTLRFVSRPAGTMAFTRWPETCVIEIDGLSPWIARKVARRLETDHMLSDEDRRTLNYVTNSIPRATRAASKALDDVPGLEWSMHFAKRGFIDQAKVKRDFGDRLERWQATRTALLTEFGRNHFWNWGAVNMGILPRP
jgi:hypothetical protein